MARLAPDWTDQRVTVGRKGERAVDDLTDPRIGVDGEVFEPHSQRRSNPFQIGSQELGAEVPGRFSHRPRPAGPLVGTQQQASGLSPGVDLAAEVDSADAVPSSGVQPRLDLGEFLGQQVHVLHGQDRQLDAAHPAHLAGPQAATVHEVFTGDGAPLGDYVPQAVGSLDHIMGPGVAVHLRTGHAGRRGVGVGHPRRVNVATHGVPEGAYEVFLDQEGDLLGRFGDRDQFGLHAQIPAAGVSHAQPVHAVLVVGQHHLAGQV